MPTNQQAFDSVPAAGKMCKLMKSSSKKLANQIIFSQFLDATLRLRYVISEALVFMALLNIAELFCSFLATYNLAWSDCCYCGAADSSDEFDLLLDSIGGRFCG